MEREITGDEFHEILTKIVVEKVTVSELLSIPEVYEALSEKYNNEVLDAWEQNAFDLDKRLYFFVIKEVNGEREYSQNCLVTANSYEEAQGRAYRCCMDWYPGDPTWRFNIISGTHYFDNECVGITFEGLAEISKEAWMEQAYKNALISPGG